MEESLRHGLFTSIIKIRSEGISESQESKMK